MVDNVIGFNIDLRSSIQKFRYILELLKMTEQRTFERIF